MQAAVSRSVPKKELGWGTLHLGSVDNVHLFELRRDVRAIVVNTLHTDAARCIEAPKLTQHAKRS
jgi:hypothetical protein